ncbi:hypothetical protein JL101_013090 [Skermanella rosea]|uniref:hypothetical protein n=1 Tax=Skermanella rosea TaxID=1817965 RepID=UPI0019319376|nr:hypothetical protein [Skermanella rosea]UEM06323.1 hypothetical protein JL101_013090 [Skermanella rosea]
MTSRDDTTRIISIDRKGRATIARSDAVPGPSADGTAVFEILNCPPAADDADVAALAQGIVPPLGIYSIDYAHLAARRGGACCGGCCGG